MIREQSGRRGCRRFTKGIDLNSVFWATDSQAALTYRNTFSPAFLFVVSVNFLKYVVQANGLYYYG